MPQYGRRRLIRMKDISITGILVLAVTIAVAIIIANWASKKIAV